MPAKEKYLFLTQNQFIMSEQNQFFKPVIIKAVGITLGTVLSAYILFQLGFNHAPKGIPHTTVRDTVIIKELIKEPHVQNAIHEPQGQQSNFSDHKGQASERHKDNKKIIEEVYNQKFVQKELQTKKLLDTLEMAYQYLQTGPSSANENIAFKHFVKVTQALSPEAITLLDKSSPLLEESRQCMNKNDSDCALKKFIKIYQPYRPQHSIY